MKLRPVVVAAAGAALVACGGSEAETLDDLPAEYRAAVEAATPGPGSGNSGFDVDTLNASLSRFGIEITVGAVEPLDDGVTKLSDVSLRLADTPDAALSASEMRLWDADFELMADYFAGKAFDRSGTVISRLEARDLSVDGLEALYGPLIEDMVASMEELQGDPDSPMPPQDLSIEGYSFTAGSMVIAGFDIHAREEPAPVDEKGDEDLTVLRELAAAARTLTVDAAAFSDVDLQMQLSQFGEVSTYDYTIDFTGYRGLDRGDIASLDVIGAEGTFDLLMPDFAALIEAPDGPPKFSPLTGEYSLASQTLSDVRLSRLLQSVVEGELMPSSETDAISFGRWTMEEANYTLDGVPFIAMDRFEMDLTDSHWIFPETASLQIDGLIYDYGAFFEPFIADIPMEDPAWDGVPQQVFDVLKRYDILGPEADIRANWNWSPEGGGIAFDFDQTTQGFGAFTMDFAGVVPAFSEWADKLPLDGSDLDEKTEAELQSLFERGSVFEGASMVIRDTGGLDKYFSAIVEIAQVLPEDQPQVAAFKNYDEATLRSMAGGFLLMGAGQANREIPGASAMAQAVADFIKEGGTLTLAMQPDTPLTAKQIAAVDAQYDGDPPPRVIMETLGIRVEHTPDE
ncbi:MAG: hypothetical protein AAFR33_02410 [Pseudomonadota bacterium]